MSKMKRNERIGAIVKILCDRPNRVYTLNHFTDLFNAAKSTISEDLVIVKKFMEQLELGKVETIAGAAGGVKYIPHVSKERKTALVEELCKVISDPKRIIPGGFLYIADLLYNPAYVKDVGEIFAESYSEQHIDCVMTVETKGIPLAMMTASHLNVPLVIARHENKVTEGSTLSINYVSGSTGKVQTMYVAKKAIAPKSNVLIVDDFMRAGRTAKGMADLVGELDSHVVGIAVLIETEAPVEKMVDGHTSILILDEASKDKINVYPNPRLKEMINF